LRGATPEGRSTRTAGLLGLLAGVALWTNLLGAPFLLAVAAICWWQRRRDLLGRRGLILLGCLMLGAAPAIVYNTLNGAATLTTTLDITALGTHTVGSVRAPALLFPDHLWLELTTSLPIVVGGFLGGYQSAGYTVSEYAAVAAGAPVAYAVNLLL